MISENFSTTPASTVYTFLFTDLEGSTRLWQEHPEAMKAALARHDTILTDAIRETNGQIVKSTGDGFHAVFTSVRDRVQACIQAQQRLNSEDWGETGPLRVRMGLHSGEAQARGGDYYGTTVNRAARLMSAANGGQVLLSAAAAGLVTDDLVEGVSLKNLGEHRLKDLQRPELIYQLVHPDLPADFPAIASLDLLPNNLPLQSTVFVGRQAELEKITDMLLGDSVRLLTLLGPGGTGKTRLALQAAAEIAEHFRDGTFFIELAPIRDSQSVLTTIARTIGLKESSDETLLEEMQAQLRDKHLLLVLDNFEQVTEAALSVAELLKYAPNLKLLVTSREALRVQGEHLFPVPPLGLPGAGQHRFRPEQIAHYEAIQLFLERAQAVKPDFELTDENATLILQICQRLDGLPLAIELAAARVRLFSPSALYDRLTDRLMALRGGARDLPERQKTLRDTIDWSYELLGEGEKCLFEIVSIFTGCTIEAVEEVVIAIGDLGSSIEDIEGDLIALVDKSLLRLSEAGSGEPRLQMLVTIKEYAAERLQENPGLNAAVCRAHAEFYAGFVQEQWRRMAGRQREAAMESMTVEVENLQLAWQYWVKARDLEALQKMVNGLWMLYDRKGWYQSAVELTRDLLDLLSETPSSPEHIQQEIMLQTSLARAMLAIKGHTAEVEQAYTRALELSEGRGEIPQLFPVLRGLASYYTYQADFEKSIQIGRRILDLAESQNNDSLRVHGYLVTGANMGFAQDFQKGLEFLDQGIAIFERDHQNLRPFQLGSNPGIVCYTSSAFFLWYLGYPDRAAERAKRAVEIANQLNHPFTSAYALFHTANLYMWRGELPQTMANAQAMLEIAREHNFQVWETLAMILIGTTKALMGQAEVGQKEVEQGFARYQGLNSPPVFYPSIIALRALALAHIGQPKKGLALLNEQLDINDQRRLHRDMLPMQLLKGDLLQNLSPPNVRETAEIYQEILKDSQHAGDRMMTLQVATRLCEMEAASGEPAGSGQALAEMYAGFTEGFETIDLQ
ncbi:MAG: adenylate/guanylate cyclase domain-containing protein, partial [Anaerolineales bacterium]